MRKIIVTAIMLLLAFAPQALAQKPIVVGTTSGSDVDILEKAVEVAARDGLKVQIKEFSDYTQLNFALAAGDIDLNAFQHIPYLTEFLAANPDAKLVSIGVTYVSPLGFFSKKIKSLDELKEGDTITIPRDVSNGGRALLLLQRAGKIKLKEGTGITPSVLDITENPLKLKIREVDAELTPATMDDPQVVAAAINNNYAQPLGINPTRDSIFLEDANSPYINVIVARAQDADNPEFKRFVKAYQTKEVADFILEKFEGATIPAFPYDK
ncbi:MAG: MetQ/NlpA family ABC transporter substrate-binding protein [Deltaproteobacteria bacterium]|jgi:D-methionine transport system substrate-binding protein|nr:MetQ/NlpA family ABC transporter substrate-binding protein [Deltaproteobacteria bacterium]